MIALLLIGCSEEPVLPVTSKRELTWPPEKYERRQGAQTPVYPTNPQNTDGIAAVKTPTEQGVPAKASPDSDKWVECRNLTWGMNIRDMNDPNMVVIEDNNKGLTVYRRVDGRRQTASYEILPVTGAIPMRFWYPSRSHWRHRCRSAHTCV